jgi:hypothetical protein
MLNLRKALSITVAAPRMGETAPARESFVQATGFIASVIYAPLTDDEPIFVSGRDPSVAGGRCS